MKKRILALFLAAVMVMAMVPSVFAADSDFTIINGELRRYNGSGGDVVVPEGVTSIFNYAFGYCQGLTSVTLPASLLSVGRGIFDGCTNLTTLNLAAGNTAFTCRDNVLFSKDMTQLVAYLPGLSGSYTVPAGVTSIGDGAFTGCSDLTGITFPATLNTIGYEAFISCRSLDNVVLPDGLYSIGGYAFGACSGMKSITIPASVGEIGQAAFMNSDSSLNVYYTGSEEQWGQIDCVLYNTSASVPVRTDTVSFADGGALRTDVMSTTIHYNSASADPGPVEPATSGPCGDNVTWSKSADGVLTISGTGDMTNYNMTTTGALTNLKSLAGEFTSAVVESGVTSIGDDAFSYSDTLESVTVGDTVTRIGIHTFANCDALERIDLPASLTEVGLMAFNQCNALTDVYYAGTQAQWDRIRIGDGNEPLTQATIHFAGEEPPKNQIGDNITWELSGGILTLTGTGEMWDSNYSFGKNVGSFTAVVIGSGITRIGNSAFCYCDELTTVTIPATVTEIADLAFCDCTALTDVYYDGTEAQWAAITVGTNNEALTKAALHCAAAPEITFPDVPADAWYTEAVDYVVENSLMKGDNNGNFNPMATITRAEVAQILYNRADAPGAGSSVFSDVPKGQWFYDAVTWAADNGLVQGSGGAFSPTNTITREQLAIMLYNAANKPAADPSVLNARPDGGKVSSWARTQMAWAVESGIITGDGNGNLNPQGTARRVEVAIMFQRFCENFG